MNSIISTIKKAPDYISYPVLYLSVATAIIGIFSLIVTDSFKAITENFTNWFNLLFLIVCGEIIANAICKNSKKSSAVVISLAVGDLIYFSYAQYHFSLLFILCSVFLLSYFSEKFDVLPGFLSCIAICVTVGLLLGCLYYIFDTLIDITAGAISENGPLFGLLDNIFLMVFGTQFRDVVLTKSYSGVQIVGDRIISGAFNVFKATINNPAALTSQYLSGKYYLNIFVTIGAYLAFIKKMDLREQVAFSSAAVVAVIFGKTELFLIFILCFNPISFFAYSVVSLLSYLTASLLDLRLGYLQNGSVFELFKYSNNLLYFLISGAVLCVLTYFVFKIVILKYDFASEKILPKATKKLVNALGGAENIVKTENDCVIVSNPNLIDVLKVDCEIHENKVTLYCDDFLLLKEYF